jgi:hypothetical protein
MASLHVTDGGREVVAGCDEEIALTWEATHRDAAAGDADGIDCVQKTPAA